jgi:hypothetical protein
MSEKRHWDVIVVGGGPAGIMAALAASRNRARTLIIERYGFLGGVLTFPLPILAFLNAQGERMVGGIPEEFIQRLTVLGGCAGHITHSILQSYTPTDGEMIKYLVVLMLQEAEVDIRLHSQCVDVRMRGNQIEEVVVCSKSGRQSYSARIFVDATGDADVVATSGAPVLIGREQDGLTQAATLDFRMANVNLGETRSYLRTHPEESFYPLDDLDTTYLFMGFEAIVQKAQKAGAYHIPRDYLIFHRILRKDMVGINTTKVPVVALDVRALTQAELECRSQAMELVAVFQRYVPGFREAYLVDSPIQVGIRETRRIVGEYTLSTEDVLKGTRFADGIARSQYPLDIHDPTFRGRGLTQLQGAYEIPYRCLIPLQIDNLLVAGRCISGTHGALSSARVMGTSMAMGQAAGSAAALCVRHQTVPRKLDSQALLQVLRTQGAIVHEETIRSAAD